MGGESRFLPANFFMHHVQISEHLEKVRKKMEAMGKQIIIRAIRAYESAIEMATDRENLRAFISEFGEGNALVRLAEDFYDFSTSDNDYLKELIERCEDIYSALEVNYIA
jgi:hypothetical protein